MQVCRPGMHGARSGGRVPACLRQRGRALSGLSVHRRRRCQRLHPALHRKPRPFARRRPGPDRRRVRAGWLCLRHHPHLSGQRPFQSRPARASMSWCSRPRRPRSSKARPGCRWNEPHDAAVRVLTKGLVQPRHPQGQARQADQGRGPQALLHASHRPLARHGRARCRRLQAGRRLAAAGAWHGADRGAGSLSIAGGDGSGTPIAGSGSASRTMC